MYFALAMTAKTPQALKILDRSRHIWSEGDSCQVTNVGSTTEKQNKFAEEGDDAYDEEQISAGDASTDDDALMYEVDTTTIFPLTQEDETSSQGDSTTHEQDGMSQMLKEFKENCEDQKLYKKYARMIEDSYKEMYKGCKPHYTKLATMLEVM